MSLGIITVEVDCDVCRTRQVIELVNLENAQNDLDRTLAESGWWQRHDFSDICPTHPKSVAPTTAEVRATLRAEQ